MGLKGALSYEKAHDLWHWKGKIALMLRGTKNGEPLGLTNDLSGECQTPSGSYMDVNEACEIWLMARDPHYKKYRAWHTKNKKPVVEIKSTLSVAI